MQKASKIALNIIPILVMIGLISFVHNDYMLTAFYLTIIILALLVKCERYDVFIFFIGSIFMTVSEYLFISTGVEAFVRQSFFGLMPLWLPILWGYGFIVIKRSVLILQ